jgi:hypothetical protein
VRGRRRAGWARKGGRRWAETIARAEIQKSKNQFLIDFWIKIGLEIDLGDSGGRNIWGKFLENCREFGKARMGT